MVMAAGSVRARHRFACQQLAVKKAVVQVNVWQAAVMTMIVVRTWFVKAELVCLHVRSIRIAADQTITVIHQMAAVFSARATHWFGITMLAWTAPMMRTVMTVMLQPTTTAKLITPA